MKLTNTDITFNNAQFYLSGNLNFSTVMSVYEKSVSLLNQHPTLNDLTFDFSSLSSSDSSSLALIMEWIKLANKLQKPIHFVHLSPDLLSLAKASGLDVFLTT